MPVESKNDNFPIKFTIPEQNVKITFRTAEDVSAFLEAETEFWTVLNQTSEAASSQKRTGFLWNIITQVGPRTIQNARNHFNAQYDGAIAAINALNTNPIIISTGKYGKRAKELAENSPFLLPGFVLSNVGNKEGNYSNNSLPNQQVNIRDLASVGRALMLQIAKVGNGNDRKSVIDDLIGELQELRDTTQTQKLEFDDWTKNFTENWTEKFDEFQIKTDDENKRVLSQVSEKTSDSLAALEKEMVRSKNRIAELEDEVKNRLVLEAPTKYWNDKACGHQVTAFIFGIIFLAALGTPIYFLLHDGVNFISNATQTIVGDKDNSGLVALVPLAFITVPSLGLAWLLRHLSRIVIQNMALGADARLRGTIALTYSALTKDQSPSEAQLALALQALFRPIDSKDHTEIAPPSLHDILNTSK